MCTHSKITFVLWSQGNRPKKFEHLQSFVRSEKWNNWSKTEESLALPDWNQFWIHVYRTSNTILTAHQFWTNPESVRWSRPEPEWRELPQLQTDLWMWSRNSGSEFSPRRWIRFQYCWFWWCWTDSLYNSRQQPSPKWTKWQRKGLTKMLVPNSIQILEQKPPLYKLNNI